VGHLIAGVSRKENLVIVYHAKEFEQNFRPRAHPWSRAESNENEVYIDFKAHPKKIRTTLEDLIPFNRKTFANKFYELLEWLNGKSSNIESNDCAFVGASENIDAQFPYKIRCSGRLMVLFRDIERNCYRQDIDWLMISAEKTIQAINPSFKAGAIGLSRVPAIYKELGNSSTSGALGEQVMFSLFAYGKNANQCYKHMEKVVLCLHRALEIMNRDMGRNNG